MLLATALVAGAAATSWATSYVMMADGDLADRAPVIALVRVIRIAPAADGSAATDYVVGTERLLKGDAPVELIVRVAGGQGADGVRLRVFASPRFVKDERALLFLHPHADGTYRISQFMLGRSMTCGSGITASPSVTSRRPSRSRFRAASTARSGSATSTASPIGCRPRGRP
jgi:hypothetical protein